jgi:large subunit ribosomal protein L24
MGKLHIKKDDVVLVISGDDKGKKGKVLAVSPEEGKVIVEGANLVKKNVKARRQGEVSQQVETESAMYACKVELVCPKCEKPTRSKIGYETDKDGKKIKVRLCTKCGAKI